MDGCGAETRKGSTLKGVDDREGTNGIGTYISG